MSEKSFISRREFLRLGVAAAGAAALSQLESDQAPREIFVAEKYKNFQLEGEQIFIQKIKTALELLGTTGILEIDVEPYIKTIRQLGVSDERGTGVYPLQNQTAFIDRADWERATEWLASIVAHEARHMELFVAANGQVGEERVGNTHVSDAAWRVGPGEIGACEKQIEVLKLLHAEESEIIRMKKHLENLKKKWAEEK